MVLIVGANVIVLSLPSSFAANNIGTIIADMPEPVADEYNKYFVVNQLLVHFSYHVSTVYTILNPTNSTWYTHQVQASESFSSVSDGTYFLPGQSLHGNSVTSSSTGTTFYDDVWFTPLVPTSSGTQNGQSEPIDIITHSDGTITYDDAELALTKVGQTELSDLFYCQLYIYDSAHLFIRLYKNDRINDNIIVTCTFYCAVYDIPSGDLVGASYSTITEGTLALKQFQINLNAINSDYELTRTIQTLKPYGFVIANPNEYEYDLPLITWNTPSSWNSYFLNTMLYVEEIWRNMVQVTSPVEPDTTARWGENLSNDSPHNELDVRPAGQEIALDNAIGNLNFSPQNQDKFEQWAGMFSNGKLIACCVFALACGSVILTLGKKKSE